jgi:hypothetical protein
MRRELPQAPQPQLRSTAVQGCARQVDSHLNGRGAAGNEQSETALQRQRRKMRATIAAFEYVEQCREVRGGIAAG